MNLDFKPLFVPIEANSGSIYWITSKKKSAKIDRYECWIWLESPKMVIYDVLLQTRWIVLQYFINIGY